MSSITRTALTAGLIFVSVGACAVETSPSDVASTSISSNAPQTFRLYNDPVAPFVRCDVGTDLVISRITDARTNRDGSVGTATLRESVPSDCDGVEQDPRTYELLYGGDECGSAVYVASMTVDGKSRSLKITVHHGRLCNDLVPAPVVVEEESASGAIRLLYARDPRDVTCELAGRRVTAGSQYDDGCNKCSCRPDGELLCTLMSCGQPDSTL